jgi:hypothetical protein
MNERNKLVNTFKGFQIYYNDSRGFWELSIGIERGGKFKAWI